ncbi:MAG: hypothetical protein ACLFS1_04040 [Opitutales bacterium]
MHKQENGFAIQMPIYPTKLKKDYRLNTCLSDPRFNRAPAPAQASRKSLNRLQRIRFMQVSCHANSLIVLWIALLFAIHFDRFTD